MAKQVVALKLEKINIRTDVPITHCSISYSRLDNGLRFASIYIHYPEVENQIYYDLDMADRDFAFILDIYKNTSAASVRKAK